LATSEQAAEAGKLPEQQAITEPGLRIEPGPMVSVWHEGQLVISGELLGTSAHSVTVEKLYPTGLRGGITFQAADVELRLAQEAASPEGSRSDCQPRK